MLFVWKKLLLQSYRTLNIWFFFSDFASFKILLDRICMDHLCNHKTLVNESEPHLDEKSFYCHRKVPTTCKVISFMQSILPRKAWINCGWKSYLFLRRNQITVNSDRVADVILYQCYQQNQRRFVSFYGAKYSNGIILAILKWKKVFSFGKTLLFHAYF